MKIAYIFLFAPSVGAQFTNIIMNGFNAASGSVLPVVNTMVETGLASVDPYTIGFETGIPLGSFPVGVCTMPVSANITIEDIIGLSSASFDEFQMTELESSDGEFIGGFETALSLGFLNVTTSGTIAGECIVDEETISLVQNFTGVASVSGASFLLGLTGEVTINPIVAFVMLNITELDLSWTSLDLTLDDLGIFQPVAEILTSLLINTIETTVNNTVNKDLIEPAIAAVLPIVVGDLNELLGPLAGVVTTIMNFLPCF